MCKLFYLWNKALLKPLFVNYLTLYFSQRNRISETERISWLPQLRFLSLRKIPHNWTVPAQKDCILFSLFGNVWRLQLLLKRYAECKANEVMEHELRVFLYSNSNPENMFHCVRAHAHQAPKFAHEVLTILIHHLGVVRNEGRISPVKDTLHMEMCCMWIAAFPSLWSFLCTLLD